MDDFWVDSWLDDVTSGKPTLSQRVMSSIEMHGRLKPAISAARARGVRLLRLTDDCGRDLVASSLRPFSTLG